MTVEFETEIRNGNIEIPEKFRHQLKDEVKVSVSVIENVGEKKAEEEPYDIISELIKNPIKVKNFKPFTRDEIYDRKL